MALNATETTAATTMLNDGWSKTACTTVIMVARRLGLGADVVQSAFESVGTDVRNLMVSLGIPAGQDL
jgi:hypothetical protein